MRTKKKQNKIGKIFVVFFQFLVVVFLIGLIFILLRGIYFRTQDKKKIDVQIEALRADVERFDQENKSLNKLVTYFDSAEFQEKEIKDKLNLVKEGERVVFVQGGVDNGDDLEATKKEDHGKIITKHPNYYYWWKYFFGR